MGYPVVPYRLAVISKGPTRLRYAHVSHTSDGLMTNSWKSRCLHTIYEKIPVKGLSSLAVGLRPVVLALCTGPMACTWGAFRAGYEKQLLVAAVTLLLLQGSRSAPEIGAIVPPLCGPLNPPSPTDPTAWLPWSSPSTWPNNQVPAAGSNVLIGCGQYVVLDVPALPGNAPSVVLNKLNISGGLLLKDDPATGNLALSASYIFVHGSFLAGTPAQHYRCREPRKIANGPGILHIIKLC
jgi:hypothetical protein